MGEGEGTLHGVRGHARVFIFFYFTRHSHGGPLDSIARWI